MPHRVRVSIVEDDQITRESLATLVRHDPDLQLVAVYPDAESAIEGVRTFPPDVVVVDIGLAPTGSGRLNGADCVAALKHFLPDLHALMLTVYDDHDVIVTALRAGASGYILKRSPTDEILSAIKELHGGGTPLSMRVARQIVKSFHAPPKPQGSGRHGLAGLTVKEQEILGLLARGATSKEIASRVGLTAGTVRVYLHTIYEKLGVKNRTQAAVRYLESQSSSAEPS
jgi:DNA-binding NarL/FixJ family response regulator